MGQRCPERDQVRHNGLLVFGVPAQPLQSQSFIAVWEGRIESMLSTVDLLPLCGAQILPKVVSACKTLPM